MAIKMFELLQQVRCDKGIDPEFFGGPCTEELIQEKLQAIFEKHPGCKIYVGITHHPCGRYTGNYQNTDALPETFPFEPKQYKTVHSMETINEEAHFDTYSKMYIICYTQTLAAIKQMEIKALACARKIDSENVGNDPSSKGGEGGKPGSDYYFLYACVSNKILS